MRTSILFLTIITTLLVACSSDKPENIVPSVRTLEATNISRTSATLHGAVSYEGKSSQLALSFRYGKGDNSYIEVSATPADNGEVAATIDGLTADENYGFLLQASNGHVTISGNTLTFTTQPNVKPTVGSVSIVSHGATSAIASFKITDYGGGEIEDAGCYVMEGNNTNLDNGTAKAFHAETLQHADSALFVVITGLKSNSSYTVYPYAVTNAGMGTGDGAAFTTGNATVVGKPGDFAKMFADSQTFEQLVIAGKMNGDDLARLRSLHVADIDMTDAYIVSGGGPYSESFYSEDNVIGSQLFAGCTTLHKITLPNSVTTISQNAFSGCTNLKEITIGAATSRVMPSGNCTSLQTINVSPANTSFKSVDGMLTNTTVDNLIWFPAGRTGNYSLPKTITAIGDYAFCDSRISSCTLPQGITKLGNGVFFGSQLETISLPAALRSLPTATFQQCSHLMTVHLGAATEFIGDYAFDGCPLTDLYVEAKEPPSCGSNAFNTSGADFKGSCTLHVPKGSSRLYRSNGSWGSFKNITED